MVLKDKIDLKNDIIDLRLRLCELALTYDVKDLVDDGGVEL